MLAVVVLGSVAGAERARADIVVFDFEGQTATAPPFTTGALTSLALTESDHGLLVVCHGTWDVVGYAGDGQVEIAFSFDYFASLDEDEEFCDGESQEVTERYDELVGDDSVDAAGVTDLPWPELERL